MHFVNNGISPPETPGHHLQNLLSDDKKEYINSGMKTIDIGNKNHTPKTVTPLDSRFPISEISDSVRGLILDR